MRRCNASAFSAKAKKLTHTISQYQQRPIGGIDAEGVKNTGVIYIQ